MNSDSQRIDDLLLHIVSAIERNAYEMRNAFGSWFFQNRSDRSLEDD